MRQDAHSLNQSLEDAKTQAGPNGYRSLVGVPVYLHCTGVEPMLLEEIAVEGENSQPTCVRLKAYRDENS